jgi:hypothetical protein
MNVQETQIIDSEGYIEKRKRRNPWFAILLALLSISLIIVGIGLLVFASITMAGVALLVLTILLLVAGVGLFITAGVYVVLSTERVETRHFSVTGHPHIVVQNEIGTIHVKAGSDADTVTFKTKLHTRRFGKAAHTNWVCYEQSVEGNEIRAEVERVLTPGINLPQPIDFDITLPANADLELLTSVGDIRVTGISGQLSLMSDSGSMYVQRGLLTGHSMLKTSIGSINFHEGIDPYGTYQFATETGSVTVILPDDTAFELDASTNLGTITTVVPGMAMAYRTNCEVHGDAGVPPRSSLTLSTITGSVSVFEESDGCLPSWHEN